LKENPAIADEITQAIQNSIGIDSMILGAKEDDEGEE
ncbi:DNA recombination/repair protein RecA, partial [Campylobacter jejuni]